MSKTVICGYIPKKKKTKGALDSHNSQPKVYKVGKLKFSAVNPNHSNCIVILVL